MKEMRSGRLSALDILWREDYQWLLEQEYKLRSRFHLDWVPPWKGNNKDPMMLGVDDAHMCEDALTMLVRST